MRTTPLGLAWLLLRQRRCPRDNLVNLLKPLPTQVVIVAVLLPRRMHLNPPLCTALRARELLTADVFSR